MAVITGTFQMTAGEHELGSNRDVVTVPLSKAPPPRDASYTF